MTTGRVYGSIRLTLLDVHGKVSLGGNNGYLDKYDFDIKDNPNNNLKTGFRNFGTRVGKALAGEGKKFLIFNYGFGRVRME
ncbi:hypothetical protein [Aquimarina algiphila]|nr:hypothetical protein [Aquimarina algiphila]